MADAPFLAEFVEFAVFDELRTTVRIQDFRYGKMLDQLEGGLDDLLCVDSLAEVVEVRITRILVNDD